MAKQNKPAIRFKGFTDAWEQRKVGELIEDYIEKTTVQNQYPVLTSSQQQGVVFQEDYFADRQVTTNDNIGYYVLPYGYFTYRSRSDTDVFIFNRNNIIDKGIISYYYPVFLPKDCDSNFLLRRLNHGIKKQLSMAAEGTGQKVLAHNKFKNMIVDVPEIEEQQKIGLYFESLDHLITLHQRKYDKLQVLKKAMLEKMFPKNGSSVPEIRFKGFTDAWEQRKLGEIATFINGRAYSQPELLSSGKYKVLRVGNFYTNDSWYYSDLELGEKYYADYGDLLYTWSATFGPHIWLGDRVIYHYHIWKINLSDQLEKQFAVQLLEQDRTNILSSKNGSTMVHITKEGMEQKDVIIPPSTKEQQEIGAFFLQLDNLITLHQRELEKLQNIKKSMLEKMFV